MSDSRKPEADETFWQHLLVMTALAIALFASIEFIPTILDGAIGAITAVIVGSVFLYYFGKHTGSLIANQES